jgi:hypothetical protein
MENIVGGQKEERSEDRVKREMDERRRQGKRGRRSKNVREEGDRERSDDADSEIRQKKRMEWK